MSLIIPPWQQEIYPDHYVAAPPGMAEFNRRLQARTGLSASGLPLHRVVWGMDEVKHLATPVGEPPRTRVLYESEAYPQRHDLGTAAFFLEQWGPPPDTDTNWDAHRYGWEEGQKLDLLGDYPRQGVYHPVILLADELGRPYSLAERIFEMCLAYATRREEEFWTVEKANAAAADALYQAADDKQAAIHDGLMNRLDDLWKEAENDVARAHSTSVSG